MLLLLTGCLGQGDGDDDATERRAAVEAGPRQPDEADRRREAQRVLDLRARAVRRGDEELFLSTLGRAAPLRARQLRWFRGAVQLPWQRFDYEVLDTSWDVPVAPRWAREALVPTVVQRTRLRGFDSRVVERDVGFVLAFDGGRARIVGDRGADGTPLLRGVPAPWDLTAVQVRRRAGVLGVFDAGSVGSAPEVMSAVADGVAALGPALPFAWRGRVVVYSVADRRVLDSFTDVPGGSIDLLGALTFPTYSRPEISAPASLRMLVLPTSVAAGQPFLGRLVRHELAHVALGTRDDAAPTWLSEGLAEYLGARSVPPAQRSIPSVALRRAQQPASGMPDSRTFNGPSQDWHYALSWMALDELAATRGEAVLWSLVEAFDQQPVGPGDARQDRVLRRVLGFDSAELARRGAVRIRSLYG